MNSKGFFTFNMRKTWRFSTQRFSEKVKWQHKEFTLYLPKGSGGVQRNTRLMVDTRKRHFSSSLKRTHRALRESRLERRLGMQKGCGKGMRAAAKLSAELLPTDRRGISWQTYEQAFTSVTACSGELNVVRIEHKSSVTFKCKLIYYSKLRAFHFTTYTTIHKLSLCISREICKERVF